MAWLKCDWCDHYFIVRKLPPSLTCERCGKFLEISVLYWGTRVRGIRVGKQVIRPIKNSGKRK